MKVDLVTPRFHPSVGGIEESVAQTAVGLRKRRHDVVVHTARLGDEPLTEMWNGVRIRRYHLVLNKGFYVSRFEPELEGELVHLHSYAHQTNDWVIERYAGKRPIVFSTHHGIRFPKPRLVARLYHWWYNRRRGIPNLRHVERILVPTSIDRDEFRRRGVPEHLLAVVPSGVDEAAFAPHAGWAPEGLRGEFLLFLGRIHREKGVADLVRAYQHGAPPMPLVIAGKDEGGLRGVGPLPPGVHVVHDLDAKRKWGLLQRCRALVLPSHYEGQGIVVAEAWAAAKPVIATRAGGLAAVVKDEANGLLVDVGDRRELAHAMARLATDAPLAKRLGAAGRREAETRYRWPKIIDTIETHYRNARR